MMSVVRASSGIAWRRRRTRLPVLADGVAPFHGLELGVGAGLHGQVQGGADLGGEGHGLDGVVVEVGGIGRGEAHPLDAVHGGDLAQEPAEGRRSVAVGVDCLPEEGDLPEALLREVAHTAQDLGRFEAALAAAHVGDDAEGAELVAAADDGHPGVGGASVRGRVDADVVLGAAQAGVEEGLVGALGQQVRQPRVGVGAGDQVDPGRPPGQRLGQVLGHAAEDAEGQARAPGPQAVELAGAADDALLRVLAHGAGVDEDHVRLLGAVDEAVPGAGEDRGHQLRVGHVHLAAVGLDVDAAPARRRRGPPEARGDSTVAAGEADPSTSGRSSKWAAHTISPKASLSRAWVRVTSTKVLARTGRAPGLEADADVVVGQPGRQSIPAGSSSSTRTRTRRPRCRRWKSRRLPSPRAISSRTRRLFTGPLQWPPRRCAGVSWRSE